MYCTLSKKKIDILQKTWIIHITGNIYIVWYYGKINIECLLPVLCLITIKYIKDDFALVNTVYILTYQQSWFMTTARSCDEYSYLDYFWDTCKYRPIT
jgi:hypothetical protein